MKFTGKIFGLLLASLTLAACGGGGSDGGSYSAPESSKITLSATRTTLPVNIWGYQPIQYGNPTQAEVTIEWRNPDGSLLNGHDVHVSISPTNVAVLSCLVDGDQCTDGNALFGSVVIKGINGRASIFVNSFNVAGTAVLTATGTDPNTNRSVSASLSFKVESGTGTQPASIQLTATPNHVYLPATGSASSSVVSAHVYDGAGQLVPDPGSGNSGFDNIRFEVVGGASRGTLSTTSASGPVSGAVVTSRTVHGVANASFAAGTEQGPVQIRATVDRSDGNVSNGIADPVSSMITLVVSDGQLYRLVITSPTTNAIEVNPVSRNIQAETNAAGEVVVPPDPNGTYSLRVSALATDRQGNPVPPGTVIEFGLVDSPMAGFPEFGHGQLLIAGPDGNPQEGGKAFTAPTGQFRTAGGGAGPGDTLLILGNEVLGNTDLESARKVAQVNSQTSLSVTYPFNPNDTTGSSVDYGPVLPYVIGRAHEGNIGATALTDEDGVASTTLNYPVSRLGKGALIWARGTGAPVNGTPRLITDISGGGFPGVAPGFLVASPSPLPGNTVTYVEVCLYDALGAPIQGAGIGFAFANLGLGTGSIDGVPTAGVFQHPTGAGGCTVGRYQTAGLSGEGGGGSDKPQLIFSAGGSVEPLPIDIAVSGDLMLQVSPSTLGGGGGVVNLLLTDGNGNPVSGVQIVAECTIGASSSLIAPTDASGKTRATITADLTGYKPPQTTATCTFKTAAGQSAKVNLQGVDLCEANPDAVPCGGEPPKQTTLAVIIDRGPGVGAAVTATVASSPGAITCELAANVSNAVCQRTMEPNRTYVLNATITPAGPHIVWSGAACVPLSGDSAQVQLVEGDNEQCIATLTP